MKLRLWAGALSAVLTTLFAGVANADVKLPHVFSSHMVLQRDTPLTVWGWDNPGQKVSVEIAGQSVSAAANAQGEWRLKLAPLKLGAPLVMTVAGSSTVKLEDVLVGEVWLCSGQSNMEMGIGMCNNAQAEIAAANHPQIRLLMVPNRFTPQPMADFEVNAAGNEGIWKACTPKGVSEGGWSGFSAAAYYFARELQSKLKIPIGVIDATWGGTVIQSWTPPAGFSLVPALANRHERGMYADPASAQYQQRIDGVLRGYQEWLTKSQQAAAAHKAAPALPAFPEELTPPTDLQQNTALFNGMIHPVAPFAIRGALWYQGESNLGEGKLYTERMKALIGGWRSLWAQGDFPFYYVQVAPYNYGPNAVQTEPEFWEAQTAAMAIPNTGMVVTNDIGNPNDIHPKNKQEVGRRLALWALAKTYGKTGTVHFGPTFKSMRTDGNKLIISFDNVGGGLKSRDGQPLTWFDIIDAEDGGFVRANAQIEGATVVLTAPDVKRPVAVRYAWHMLAEPNLSNAEGLPANSFRAGEVPKRDVMSLHVPESKTYALVYDMDLNKLAHDVKYDVDNHRKLTKAFDRIAYCLELTKADGSTQFVYTSMDAFTTDASKIGIPTLASGARFQQNVKNLNVYSNVPSIAAGLNIAGGNIEFWPDNYEMTNGGKVPGASSEFFDFGDQPTAPADGYGCMQVHNHDAKQTIFAINHWVNGSNADLGIGNQPAPGQPDWTFASNGNTYIAKRLRVLVHYTP